MGFISHSIFNILGSFKMDVSCEPNALQQVSESHDLFIQKELISVRYLDVHDSLLESVEPLVLICAFGLQLFRYIVNLLDQIAEVVVHDLFQV
jgi:hypothetical protein